MSRVNNPQRAEAQIARAYAYEEMAGKKKPPRRMAMSNVGAMAYAGTKEGRLKRIAGIAAAIKFRKQQGWED